MIADRQKILELRKEYDEFPLEWQRERRLDYREGVIEDLRAEALREIALHRDYVRRGRVIEMLLTKECIDKLLVKIIKAQDEVAALRRPDRPDKNDITPEMIERARAYPFAELYEFKRNMAPCPFHQERTPSFALMKDNTARCFGACSASWDTIAFIRDREGLSFPEAVRRLQ